MNVKDYYRIHPDASLKEYIEAEEEESKKRKKELEQLGQVSEWVKALESKRWQDEILKEAAHAIKQRMQKMGKWLEQSKAKKPEKDKDYQATLKVKNFL